MFNKTRELFQKVLDLNNGLRFIDPLAAVQYRIDSGILYYLDSDGVWNPDLELVAPDETCFKIDYMQEIMAAIVIGGGIMCPISDPGDQEASRNE